jgi:phenylacetic acid degradation operon negative regulatory protein
VSAIHEAAHASESSVASSPQPRQLIVSLYGLYARQTQGWLSVRGVIRLMAELGIDDQSVRSSISRLKRRGLLIPQRIDGVAGYALSDEAQRILAEGDARIFGRRRATRADGWLLVVFSVPESKRDKRHLLRSRLTRLGFGTVAPGIWVAPGHLEAEADDLLNTLEMTEYVEMFRGSRVGSAPVHGEVGRWWDLEALQRLYASFITRYASVRARWARIATAGSTGEAFAEYVEMLTIWRQLPYADPGLPLDFLPEDWAGIEAEELFAELRGLLAGPAELHAREMLGSTAY